MLRATLPAPPDGEIIASSPPESEPGLRGEMREDFGHRQSRQAMRSPMQTMVCSETSLITSFEVEHRAIVGIIAGPHHHR